MKFRTLLLVVLLASGFSAVSRAQEDVRFSKAIAATEFSQIGLGRLSSDQLASLDALVRRDLAIADRTDPAKHPRPARFSDRLSTNERTLAGLNRLSDTELASLDAAVQRLTPPPRGAWLAANAPAAPTTIYSEPLKRGPEIHGSFTLMVGAGSHGYSEYGGAMVVSVEDPQHHLAFAVGYSELHTKGGYPWRYCYDPYGYGYGYSRFDSLGLSAALEP